MDLKIYSVTYQINGKNRRKTYKSLTGAKRSIWKWIVKNKKSKPLAILYAPLTEPEYFESDEQLPFEEKESLKIDFYSTQKWKKLRYVAFTVYQNVCACCGASPKSGATLHVDHIKPRSHFPELQWDVTNLQILCETCNLGKSNSDETKWRC